MGTDDEYTLDISLEDFTQDFDINNSEEEIENPIQTDIQFE